MRGYSNQGTWVWEERSVGECTDAERTGAVRKSETHRNHGLIYSRAQIPASVASEIGNLDVAKVLHELMGQSSVKPPLAARF